MEPLADASQPVTTFQRVAACFEQLEHTAGRARLVELLAELFAQISVPEIPEVSYLLQGRVAPWYQPVEFGLGERSVAAAIASAFSVERDSVLAQYGQAGDLGTVAQRLSQERWGAGQPPPELSVTMVFTRLRQIADLAGSGSAGQKVAVLADLLTQLDPLSAKHLVRVPLGAARLGVGDVTILAAFAQAKLGGAKQRKLLEEAYNRTSDLGLLGQTLWRDGVGGVQALGVAVGRPMRAQLAERLPDSASIVARLGGRAHVQMKFDGVRVQIHLDRRQPEGAQVHLYSRNLEDFTGMFPELVAGTLRQVQAETAILDAEALAYNPASDEFLPFQETMRRRRKERIDAMALELPLRAMVFDVMYRDGQSLLDRPLLERLGVLAASVQGDDPLSAQPGEVVETVERMQALFDEALSLGLEGLVVKRVDSPYQAGARNFNWVKLKKHAAGALEDTIDCVLLGYIYGRGKRADFGVGALLAGVYDPDADAFVTVSKVGTGLSDEQWRAIPERAAPYLRPDKPARVRSLITPSVWLEPALVMEILADEITPSPHHTAGRGPSDTRGYALRFPRFLRFREADKRPEDATTTGELLQMYRNQGSHSASATSPTPQTPSA